MEEEKSYKGYSVVKIVSDDELPIGDMKIGERWLVPDVVISDSEYCSNVAYLSAEESRDIIEDFLRLGDITNGSVSTCFSAFYRRGIGLKYKFYGDCVEGEEETLAQIGGFRVENVFTW
jgi:hypothetical protein